MATTEERFASPDVHALMIRYKEAYKTADGVVGAGRNLRMIGGAVIVIAIFGALGGFAVTGNQFGDMAAFGAVIIGVVGFIWGNAIMARGQLLMSQGQSTMAMLDNAVYNSSFLDNDHRSRVLGLPSMANTLYKKANEKVVAS